MSITTRELLAAYARGYFPMAESRTAKELYWFYPEMRGILPLESFHVPRSVQKFMRSRPFRVSVNEAFAEVITACAKQRPDNKGTWINDHIIALYTKLHQEGYAHSVECWQGEQLAGGLYGVALGGAFFGESMFSSVSGASKVALVALVERLKKSGYTLLDTQYANEHLAQFGVMEIPRMQYLRRLEKALEVTPAPISSP